MLHASRPPGSLPASQPTPHAPRARSYLPPRPATNDQREAKKRLAPSSALPPFARLFSRVDDGHSITTPQQSAGSPRVHAGEHEDRPEGVAVAPYVQRNLQMSIPAGDVPDVGTLPRRQRGAGFIPELMDSRGASPNSLTCPDQAMEFQDRSLGFHTLRQIGMNVLGKKLGGVRL